MLLRNESRVKHSIQIKLVFDDDRVRELEISEFDYVQVSYRKNGCIRQGVGIIREIKPYMHSKRWTFCRRMAESAIITLDMSEDLVSCVDKFDMNDIIDIRKLKPPCCCECCPGKDNTESEDKSDENIVDCPVTDKGVGVSD